MLQPEKEQKKHCDEVTGQEKDRKCQRIPKASYLEATSHWTCLSILHPAPRQQPWHWDGEGEVPLLQLACLKGRNLYPTTAPLYSWCCGQVLVQSIPVGHMWRVIVPQEQRVPTLAPPWMQAGEQACKHVSFGRG